MTNPIPDFNLSCHKWLLNCTCLAAAAVTKSKGPRRTPPGEAPALNSLQGGVRGCSISSGTSLRQRHVHTHRGDISHAHRGGSSLTEWLCSGAGAFQSSYQKPVSIKAAATFLIRMLLYLSRGVSDVTSITLFTALCKPVLADRAGPLHWGFQLFLQISLKSFHLA